MTTDTKVNELDDEKVETRLDELYQKKDKSEDEVKEFSELKKERSSRAQKAIDKANSKLKEAEYKYGKLSDETAQLRKEMEEIKKSQENEPVSRNRETVKFGEKSFYTDEALGSLVQNGDMSEQEAWKHQRERDKVEAAEIAYERIKKEREKETDESVRNEDREKVLKDYPHFNKDHPNHDPEDPLYKEASRIWQNGYKYNPRGLSEALNEAKRIVGKLERKDNSDDHTVFSSPSGRRSDAQQTEGNGQKPTLNQYESETAIKQWCRGDIVNPATGRAYTEKEALAKALKAKQRRVGAA